MGCLRGVNTYKVNLRKTVCIMKHGLVAVPVTVVLKGIVEVYTDPGEDAEAFALAEMYQEKLDAVHIEHCDFFLTSTFPGIKQA